MIIEETITYEKCDRLNFFNTKLNIDYNSI